MTAMYRRGPHSHTPDYDATCAPPRRGKANFLSNIWQTHVHLVWANILENRPSYVSYVSHTTCFYRAVASPVPCQALECQLLKIQRPNPHANTGNSKSLFFSGCFSYPFLVLLLMHVFAFPFLCLCVPSTKCHVA